MNGILSQNYEAFVLFKELKDHKRMVFTAFNAISALQHVEDKAGLGVKHIAELQRLLTVLSKSEDANPITIRRAKLYLSSESYRAALKDLGISAGD